MLSIYTLTSAEDASKYYEVEDYYAKDSKEAIEATHWWGKGTSLLGLSGYVDKEMFTQLLEGKLPTGEELGKIKEGELDHRPGYDLTFSAPKSVSLLAEVGDDKRIHEAHDRAVNEALSYLERHVSQTRKQENRVLQFEKTDNLAVAKFRHNTSRDLDPALHTHCVILNMVQRKDGEWRSLSSEKIYDYKMLGGLIYRSKLAIELQKLGYNIERTREDGLFEVVGISKDDLMEFSKRRQAIEKLLEERNWSGGKESAKATLITRIAKVEVDRDKLFQAWKQEAAEMGMDLAPLISSAKQNTAELHGGISVSRTEDRSILSLRYAAQHLGEREAIFTEQQLFKTALAYGLGDVHVGSLEKALLELQVTTELIHLGDGMLSTDIAIKREQHLIELMQQGRGTVEPLTSPEVVSLFLADKTFGKGQQDAVRLVLTTEDRVVGIEGFAGVGKTTLVNGIREFGEQLGAELRGVAPNAAAARVLEEETGIPSQTVAKYLLESPPKRDESQVSILILDESSMVSSADMEQLLQKTAREDVRLIIMGDNLQLASVEAGAPPRQLQKHGLKTAFVKEIRRQKNPDMLKAVKYAIAGDIERAFQKVGNNIQAIENKEQRLWAMAEQFLHLTDEERRNTLLIVPANADRVLTNDYVRQGLKERGTLTGESISTDILERTGFTRVEQTNALNYKINDTVLFNRAYRSLGIQKKSYYTVKEIFPKGDKARYLSPNTLILESETGETLIWNPTKTRSRGAVEVYRTEERELMVGDKIRWTKNQYDKNLLNSEVGYVTAINGTQVSVQPLRGETIHIDIAERSNRHWDHAWAQTVYSAQGSTTERVIAHIDSHQRYLATTNAFYVILSRAKYSAHLYVDNVENVIDAIQKRSGQKDNALEFLDAYRALSQFEKDVGKSAEKLKGNIHEYRNTHERCMAFAERYVSLSSRERNNTLCVVPQLKERLTINQLIRTLLKDRGELSGEEINVQALAERHLPDLCDVASYKVGDIIRFNREYQRLGVSAESYWEVKNKDEKTGQLNLQRIGGETFEITWFPSKKFSTGKSYDIDVYYPSSRSLMVGDKIQWMGDDKKQSIRAGKIAQVVAMTHDIITFKIGRTKKIQLSLSDLNRQQWDYAYTHHLYNAPPKEYNSVLAFVDERLKTPAQQQRMLGLMGRAKNAAYAYTHSALFLTDKIELHTGIHLSEEESRPSNRLETPEAMNKLARFDMSTKELRTAWMQYYADKEKGENITEHLSRIQALERAHQELSESVLSEDTLSSDILKAFGFKPEKIAENAEKHRRRQTVEVFLAENRPVHRDRLAYHLSKELSAHYLALREAGVSIDAQIFPYANAHKRRLDYALLDSGKRADKRLVDTYYDYRKRSYHAWSTVFEQKKQSPEKKISTYAVQNAQWLTQKRNQLAYAFLQQPRRYQSFLNSSEKNQASLKQHAEKHDVFIKKQAARDSVLNTKDWRQALNFEQKQNTLSVFSAELKKELHVSPPAKHYWDKNRVLDVATDNAEYLISGLVGEAPNARLSRGKIMAWGKKGSVKVHLSGSKRGVVNDFERGIHGDIITYTAKMRQIPWHEALESIAKTMSLDASHRTPIPFDTQLSTLAKTKKEDSKQQMRKIRNAQSIWSSAAPLEGTPAELYLREHRGIKADLSQSLMRYHPRVVDYEFDKEGNFKQKVYRPALVVAARNANNEVMSVQSIYLDPYTANKDKSLEVVKRTHAPVWGYAAQIQQGTSKQVVLAEGIETAASLIVSLPQANIYVSLGNNRNMGNLAWLAKKHQTHEILIAADNDDGKVNTQSWEGVKEAASQLACDGVTVRVVKPALFNDRNSVDFNDVLIEKGDEGVQVELDNAYVLSEAVAISVSQEEGFKKEDKQSLDLEKDDQSLDTNWLFSDVQKEEINKEYEEAYSIVHEREDLDEELEFELED